MRFAAAQSFRRTAEREITQPDVFHETQPLLNFRDEIGRDRFLGAFELQLVDLLHRFTRRQIRELIDRLTLNAHMPRDRVQTRAVTTWTFARFRFVDPFELALGRQFVFQDRIARFFRAGLKFLVPNVTEPAAFFARAVRRVK